MKPEGAEEDGERMDERYQDNECRLGERIVDIGVGCWSLRVGICCALLHLSGCPPEDVEDLNN